jgi:hypothetical protein
MPNLRTLYQTIDRLDLGELGEVRHYIEQRQREKLQQAQENADRNAQLRAALAEFRSDTSPDEWATIADAMNAEYVESDEPGVFDWLDDTPESER